LLAKLHETILKMKTTSAFPRVHGRRSVEYLKHFAPISLCTYLLISTAQAQPDYGPAIWRQAYPNHWYTSGNGHHFCVIHDMEGYYLSSISFIQGGGGPEKVSIHYCVNGLKDNSSDAPAGELTQMVREAYYAWHAGCWNTWMFGTEHEGFASNPAWYTEAMYQASAGLQQHLCAVGGIPKDRNHIIAHGEGQNQTWKNWMAANYPSINTSCNSHTDPGPYWDWNHFMNLVVGSVQPGRLDIFIRGTDNALWHKWYDNGWYNWENLGGVLTSDPSAVSWGQGRIDVFARGTAGDLQHKWYSGTSWSAWESLGGGVVGAPDSASWGSGRLDVFVHGTNNKMYTRTYNTTSWSAWTLLDLTDVTSDPGAVSWGPNRIDLFARGTDNTLYHKVYDNAWYGWESLGGALNGAPDVASWGSGHLDIVVRGTDNACWHRAWNGAGWTAWESLGGTLTSDPSAVSSAGNRLDIFARGADGTLIHKWWDGVQWYAWESLGGGLTGGPDACSWTH
jgi:N-acetylmuramoyl-L-alanine amidase/Repeat of unknown function (DUF346)